MLSENRLTAAFVGIDGEAMVLSTGGRDTVVVPLASITKLEATTGTWSLGKVGMGVGFAVGMVVGATTQPVGEPTDKLEIDIGTPFARVAAFGLGGALFGGVIGSLVRLGRWEEVPLDELRIEPSSVTADGVSVSALLRF